MARNSQRGRNNNNPEGRNQYSGWMDTARDRPLATAATAAAAVGASVFLWSRRNQISDQLSNLSDQISDWTQNMRSSEQDEFETMDTGGGSPAAMGSTSSRTSRSTGSRPTSTRGGSSNRSTRGMSETGGGNASLGAHTGSGTGASS